jgi:signal transduction histidine kinase
MAAAAQRDDTPVHQVQRRDHLLMVVRPTGSRRAMRWALAVVVCLAAGSPLGMSAQEEQKRVLVLYAQRRDAQFTVTVESRLPSLLEHNLPEGLDYYSEFIDQTRFQQPDYQNAFRDFVRMKYRGQHLDALILIGSGAIQFLAGSRETIFPNTPIVFYTNMPLKERMGNATGIVNLFRLGRSIDLALTLQPDLRQLFVVTGAAAADRRMEQQARSDFERFKGRLDVTYLAGLAASDLEARLKALPLHSAVFFGLVSEDGRGETFQVTEYLTRLTALSNAPIYSWADISTETGIVGGNQRNQLAQTQTLADMTLRVLRGERADAIPLSTADTDVNQVDWRQLQRWGISESRVPQGTRVLFKELSAWNRYWVYILGAAVLLLAQTLLIAGLLVQRRRRQLAEKQVEGHREALQNSHDRIRALGSRLLLAQDTERSRIARELHDDISQQVALLSIDLELLSGTVPSDSEVLAGDALNRAQHIARSVHDLSHRLHPAKLRLIGLVAALQALQREMSRAEPAIVFTHDNVPAHLPPDMTVSLFRVVQEALQNAVKYSRAHVVRVHLDGGSNRLVLRISDDGVGFDVGTAWGKGLGLISISERIEALGGTLDIRSAPGAGTSLEIRVPLASEPAADAAAAGPAA